MISVNRRTLYGEVYNDVRCLSSDEKPTEGVKNGSTLIEIDTGKRYLYDALSGSWNEFSQGGGGEYVLPTMSTTTKGGATVGEGLTMDGTALSVDYSEVASVDALEGATALSPTGGIVSTQDGLAISPEQSSTGAIDGALLELTAKSKPATQATTDDPPSPSPDYPQPIVTVRGRNLLTNNVTSRTVDGVTFTVNADGSVTCNGTAGSQANFYVTPSSFYLSSGAYFVSGCPNGSAHSTYSMYVDGIEADIFSGGRTITVEDSNALRLRIVIRKGVTVSNLTFYPQLTKGSTPQPYVPYGYIGLERRDSQGTLLDTIPIPLPSRGWVAGLPDGTADELSVDGAGKVEWELKTGMEQYSSTEMTFTENKYGVPKKSVHAYMSWSYPKICTIVPPISAASDATRVYFDTRYNSKLETYEGEFELYWKLPTPVTETCGYVDLPSMQDCVLSIPELDALGVRYTIGDGTEIARQWYQRAHSEYEQRITDLEEAVAELTAGA